ncbi:MAG TPA: adenylate/guanylate cyclase domain-containing protein [Actinomycetota bacterium]|nr:adenylate/guanylate cyclase domain-containing protein [Actinomycetota bacterium]
MAGPKERKYATVLFADLVGYTQLVERHDPEIAEAIVMRVFDVLTREVERHGGITERLIGDALLAVFGIPAAHEDDPERAVRAALRILDAVSELNHRLSSEGKPEVAIRIGVEAGEVLVDHERAEASRERMLTGDAVNTAARLQGIAQPGSVLVGADVYAATKAVIEYEDLGPVMLKGKEESVLVFLARTTKRRLGGGRAPLGLEAPLIGRDHELGTLQESIERAQSEERSVLITILGPPGIGKSRLARELGSYVDSLPDNYYWRIGRSRAYGDVAYSALVDVVKAQCEILDDDPPEVVARKIEDAVHELCGDHSIVPEIRSLVGGEATQTFRRDRLFDAWQRFLERMATRYPLILVFEDIHWADDGLLDFIDYLAEWARGPIAVVTMARPELLDRRPGWGRGKRNYVAIDLHPLSEDESETMLQELVSGSLPDEVTKDVVERGEGNPLFTEEIVRMLIDRGRLRQTSEAEFRFSGEVGDIEVPRSIRMVIAARLDGLSWEQKSLLQDAAVVGRIFWGGIVAALADFDLQQTENALKALQAKELIAPRNLSAFSNQSEYSFHHVLIRDVAYESLPKVQRATRHEAAARWLELQAAGRKEELAQTIASHYAAALSYINEVGDLDREHPSLIDETFRWARAAGDRAAEVWETQEALRWYQQALDLGEVARVSEMDKAGVWESYARAGSRSLPYDETRAAFQQALKIYDLLGEDAHAGRVETSLADGAIGAGRTEEVEGWIDRALVRLEPLGTSGELGTALYVNGRHLWMQGRLDEAEPLLRRAITLAERLGAVLVEAHATLTLGAVVAQSGRELEGHRLTDKAYEMARAVNDLDLYLRASNNLAWSLWERAEYERQETVFRDAITVAKKSGQVHHESWMRSGLAGLLEEFGRLEEAQIEFQRSLDLARKLDSRAHLAQVLCGLAWCVAVRGAIDDAEEYLTQAEALAGVYQQQNIELAYAQGVVSLARGDLDKSLDHFRAAAEPDAGPDVDAWALLEAVRALAKADRRREAAPFRDRLVALADRRMKVNQPAAWAEALVVEDPGERGSLLEEVVAMFQSQGLRLEEGRALIDLGDAYRDSGKESGEIFERARNVLEECGAELYLRELRT